MLWAVFLGETTTVISVGEREAREVVEMAFKHAKVLEKLGSKWAKCKLKGDGIVFENGGRILALPASSAGRGFSGNVFLDEYAYLEAPEKVWDGAAAVTTHGYRLRVSSTPNGVGNDFHDHWTNEKRNKGWSKHCTTLHDALAAGLTSTSVERCMQNAKGDPRVFSQLYGCEFLDGSEQYIPTQLVRNAVLENTQVVMGDYYAGYDVGYENDLSVLVLLRQTRDNKVWVQSIQAGQRVDWQVQKQNIFRVFGQVPIRKMCMDETGIGSGLVKDVQHVIGAQKAVGIVFTLQSKEEMATDLYQAFASGMIHIPNDPALIKDILSIRRTISPSGKIIYDAPRTVDGHADRAWALALAIHACTNKPGARVMKGPGDFDNT